MAAFARSGNGGVIVTSAGTAVKRELHRLNVMLMTVERQINAARMFIVDC